MKKPFDKSKADFEGWATKNDLKCSDGRTIRHGAFDDNDGQVVPLIWSHQHSDPYNVLGHALLETRRDGVYTYGQFNDTEAGQVAKVLVKHGDISALSIYANQLRQVNGDVLHGNIREVSLVLAGANPGAYILSHSDTPEDEGVIFTGERLILSHAESTVESGKKSEDGEDTEEKEDKRTIKDVFDTMNEDQKNVAYALIAAALEEQQKSDKSDENKEDNIVKHNAFEANSAHGNDGIENTLSHADFSAVMNDLPRYGSLKASFIQHGIEQIDYLFPEARNLNTPPEFIQRDTGWVQKVMSSVHRVGFARIKSMFANITEDDARARGYIKGNRKVDEVFGLLKRQTTPTTVYKKQSMDRDDVVDITDFDVIAWLKGEMRGMLNEELARAYLIGDGRALSSNDKINEQCIRPIMKDDDLYTIKASVSLASNATDDQKAKAFIRAAVKARKDYKGTGEPTLYTTEEMLMDLRLLEDGIGHILYDSDAKLANALRVKEVVAVPLMDGITGPNGGELMGIIVNLADYYVGADKGGAVSLFDDFDIDYNQQKYLIETRCSGALTKPFSAIVLESSINSSAPVYKAVTPTEGANPAESGWYEKILTAYVLTRDTAVKSGKTYYELDTGDDTP